MKSLIPKGVSLCEFVQASMENIIFLLAIFGSEMRKLHSVVISVARF